MVIAFLLVVFPVFRARQAAELKTMTLPLVTLTFLSANLTCMTRTNYPISHTYLWQVVQPEIIVSGCCRWRCEPHMLSN